MITVFFFYFYAVSGDGFKHVIILFLNSFLDDESYLCSKAITTQFIFIMPHLSAPSSFYHLFERLSLASFFTLATLCVFNSMLNTKILFSLVEC
jgi:hypothetical protein